MNRMPRYFVRNKDGKLVWYQIRNGKSVELKKKPSLFEAIPDSEIIKGIEEEMEHAELATYPSKMILDSPEDTASVIALHHLYKEDPNYYSKLKSTFNNSGYKVEGNTHEEGGELHSVKDSNKKYELEDGEVVLNANSMKDKKIYTVSETPKQIASKINEVGGGVRITTGGSIFSGKKKKSLVAKMKKGGEIQQQNVKKFSKRMLQTIDMLLENRVDFDKMPLEAKEEYEEMDNTFGFPPEYLEDVINDIKEEKGSPYKKKLPHLKKLEANYSFPLYLKSVSENPELWEGYNGYYADIEPYVLRWREKWEEKHPSAFVSKEEDAANLKLFDQGTRSSQNKNNVYISNRKSPKKMAKKKSPAKKAAAKPAKPKGRTRKVLKATSTKKSAASKSPSKSTASKLTKSAAKKLTERAQLKGRSKRAVAQDKDRKALKAGRRVSASGNVYYENRPNRSDVDRRKKL